MDIKPRPNHARHLEVLRNMTPTQRLKRAFELSDMTRRLFFAGLRKRFPDATEQELKAIAMKRLAQCHNRNY
jgi:hypothetical protein